MGLTENTEVLGRRNAKHLLSRTTFNITKTRIDSFATKTPQEALSMLFDYEFDANWLSDTHPYDLMPTTNNNVVRKRVIAWWLSKAQNDPTIHHKLTLFLFKSFSTDIFISSPDQYFEYLKLLSLHTKGSYQSLAYYMTKDNVMLGFLDGSSNIKDNPNENYAREFFELFTIGKGATDGPGSYTNYTESDIAEAAKLLTGWVKGGYQVYENSHADIYGGYCNSSRHDSTDKIFSDKFNNTIISGSTNADDELQEFVAMVFQQMATAKNICTKLYHFFVSDVISADTEANIIEPLSLMLFENDYHIEVVIKELLSSKHFYDMDDDNPYDHRIGSIVKSPLDLMLGTMSYLNVEPLQNYAFSYYTYKLNDLYLASSSMHLFSPPNVAGYPAYYQEPLRSKNWFDSNTYLPRYKFIEMLLTGKNAYGTNPNGNAVISFDVLGFIDNTDNIPDPTQAGFVVTTILDDLFPEGYDNDRYDYFLNTIFLDGLNAIDWALTWDAYKNGGNDAFTKADATTEIKIRVRKLLQAVMQSPEFQLM